MDAPQLEISHQNAEIEVTTHKARVEISTRRSQFRMKRNMARFIVDHRMPTMRIDRTLMYTALGIGPVLQAARQYFSDSIQAGIQSVGRIASDGTAMMNIQNGGNPLADMAEQAAFIPPLELNTASLPQAEISWDPGYINIHWTPGSIAMEWDVSSWADIRVEPHYVEIRMKKYPDVRIRVSYKPRNQKPRGKYVDKYL